LGQTKLSNLLEGLELVLLKQMLVPLKLLLVVILKQMIIKLKTEVLLKQVKKVLVEL
jgi:hypothetical protein